jgi:hypothetical protein
VRSKYEWLATHDTDWRRALEVQAALWHSGRVRAAGFPDLLIAAVAEREQVTVLHYDNDFDIIASVTGQPVQWVVPPRSVPWRGDRAGATSRSAARSPGPAGRTPANP